jgi:Ribbon-helix-helix protein, copG family
VASSWSIERGKKANRVRYERRRYKTGETPSTERSPQRAVSRWQRDPDRSGGPTTTVCISLSAAELAAMDALADAMRVCRSQLIRDAVRALAKGRGV